MNPEADRHCMTCGHEFIEQWEDETWEDGTICPACGSDDTLAIA